MHNSRLLTIDGIAQVSGLNHINDSLKITLGLCSMLLCMAAKTIWLMLFISLAMVFISVHIGKVSGRVYLRLLAIPSLFILLSCLAIVIQISDLRIGLINVSFGGTYLAVTKSSLGTALFTACRSYSAVACLYMISLSTPLSEIINTLNKLKFPAIAVELMYLIYRYVTILVEVHYQMTVAAKSRLGYTSRRNTLRSACGIAKNLLLLSFQRAATHFHAMVSRGYHDKLTFWQEEKPVRPNDIFWTVFYFIVIGILFIGERICL